MSNGSSRHDDATQTKYFTTVTKLKICAHHLLLMIILSILKCVTLYQVTIIPSYLYSEMWELKIFKDF
jgi:hypothetical protein